MGVVPADSILSPRPSWVPPWDGLGNDERCVYARFQEVFATLYHNIGLNPNEVRIFDPNGRPQYLVDGGVNLIQEVV